MTVPAGPLRKALQFGRSLVLIGWRLRGALPLYALWLCSRKQWTWLASLSVIAIIFRIALRRGRPAQFWRHMLEDPLLDTPRLYILSEDDHLTAYDPLQKLIDQRRCKGQKGLRVLKFPTSEHCGHLRQHREQYTKEVFAFVEEHAKSK